MKTKDIIEKTAELARSVAQQYGVSIWDVTFEKEGGAYCLTVYIDKDGGIFVDDCENISRAIDPLLDRYDYIDCAYTLCVSSAGIERTIRLPEHYDYAVGKLTEIKLFAPINGSKSLVGILKSHDSANVVLSVASEGGLDDDITVAKKDIALCKLCFEY